LTKARGPTSLTSVESSWDPNRPKRTLLNETRLAHANDLLHPDWHDRRGELVCGKLVAMAPVGWDHNESALQFTLLFDRFCRERPGH
jgi:hypothetical protein